VPLPGSRDAGKLAEIEPGVGRGRHSRHPQQPVYSFDLREEKLRWEKELLGRAFGGVRGFDRRLIKGPDGYLWLYLDNTI